MVVQDPRPESREGSRWDPLALELQALRTRAGEPSFAEVARRISERRLAGGASKHAARVARTTVYDAFRTGRARVNLELVREIVMVLDGCERDVETWVGRCREQLAGESTAAARPTERAAGPVATTALPPTSTRQYVVLMAACLGINLLGRMFVDFLDLEIHLDMVGTAIAAMALGPWRGAAVGASTNIVGALASGPDSIPFALVNVAGALLWGYGARRLEMGRTLPRFFALNLAVGVLCSLVAVPILVLLYGGTTADGPEPITTTLLALTDQFVLAVGLSNLLVSLADKLVSGFVALVFISALPLSLRIGSCLVLAAPPPPPPATR